MLRKRIKRIICGLLSVLVLSSNTAIIVEPLTVNAEVDYSAGELAADMISYYRQKNSYIESITGEDLLYFGVFLSNFYTPFETNVADSEAFNTLVYDTMTFLKGEEITSEDPIGSVIAGNVQANMMNLPNLVDANGDVYTLQGLYGNTEAKDLYASGYKAVVYQTPNATQDNYTAIIQHLLLKYIDKACEKDRAKIQELLLDTTSLVVSPFGDILTSEGTIIVPACMNPYVFADQGIAPTTTGTSEGTTNTENTNTNSTPTPSPTTQGIYNNLGVTEDLNGDGVVDLKDVTIYNQQHQQTVAEGVVKKAEVKASNLKEQGIISNENTVNKQVIVPEYYTNGSTSSFDVQMPINNAFFMGSFSLTGFSGNIKELFTEGSTEGTNIYKNYTFDELVTSIETKKSVQDVMALCAEAPYYSDDGTEKPLTEDTIDVHFLIRGTDAGDTTFLQNLKAFFTGETLVQDINDKYGEWFGTEKKYKNINISLKDIYGELALFDVNSLAWTTDDVSNDNVEVVSLFQSNMIDVTQSPTVEMIELGKKLLEELNFSTLDEAINICINAEWVTTFGTLTAANRKAFMEAVTERTSLANAKDIDTTKAMDVSGFALAILYATLNGGDVDTVHDEIRKYVEKDGSGWDGNTNNPTSSVAGGGVGHLDSTEYKILNDKNWLGVSDINNTAYNLITIEQNIASILASQNKDSMNRATNVNYFANMYYAYSQKLFAHGANNAGNPGFPVIKLNTDAANMLSEIQDSINQQMDASKLLNAQWSLLKRLLHLTDTSYSATSMYYSKSITQKFAVTSLLGIHEGILGTQSVGTSLVSTSGNQYNGVVGYATLPRLNEMTVTKTFTENFQYIYIILMVIVIACTLLMFIAHIKTWQQCIAGILAMSIVLTLPIGLIDMVVVLTNNISNVFYTDRFEFWAITQHQQEIQQATKAAEEDDDTYSLLSSSLNTYKDYYSSDSVQLKWMSPKKTNMFNQIFGTTTSDDEDSLTMATGIFRWLFSGYMQQESYSADNLATYVYRPYSSLCAMAKQMWDEGINSAEVNATTDWRDLDNYAMIPVLNALTNGVTDKQSTYDYKPEGLNRLGEDIGNTDVGEYVNKDRLQDISYSVLMQTDSNSLVPSEYKTAKELWKSYAYRTQVVDDSHITKLFMSEDIYNALIFSKIEDTSTCTDIGYSKLAETEGVWTGDDLAFMLYSESPFYYFYNVYKNSFCSKVATATAGEIENTTAEGIPGGILTVEATEDSEGYITEATEEHVNIAEMLQKEPDNYHYGDDATVEGSAGMTGFTKIIMSDSFFKADGDSKYTGLLRDYMDLEGLFGIVIPYLRIGNDYVREWTSEYSTDFNFANDTTGHTKNLEYVWALYSPWIAALEESWAKPQKIKYADSKINITDMLSPFGYVHSTSDLENVSIDRYMAFGEADIAAKGYGSYLTDVEKRINKVLQDTYIDLRYLTNYAGFDNEVIISMAAMISTFNFNRVFTDTSTDTVEMYPTGFELKNFSYDAYLRMIMLNSTGASLTAHEGTVSIYQTIIMHNVFAGVLLIIVDICAVVVLPVCKLIFFLCLLLLSLALSMLGFLQDTKEMLKVFGSAVVKPLVKFALTSIVHTYINALLMGEGMTNYVGSRSATLVTNDPTTTTGLLVVINLVVSYIYIKAVISLIKDLKKWGTTFMSSVSNVFTSTTNQLYENVVTQIAGVASTSNSSNTIKAQSTGDYTTEVNNTESKKGTTDTQTESNSSILGSDLDEESYSFHDYAGGTEDWDDDFTVGGVTVDEACSTMHENSTPLKNREVPKEQDDTAEQMEYEENEVTEEIVKEDTSESLDED